MRPSVRPPPRVVPPKHLFEPAVDNEYAYFQQTQRQSSPSANENDFDRDVREQMKILEDNIRGMIDDNPKSFDVFSYSDNKNNDLFMDMARQQREESLQPQLFMYSSKAQSVPPPDTFYASSSRDRPSGQNNAFSESNNSHNYKNSEVYDEKVGSKNRVSSLAGSMAEEPKLSDWKKLGFPSEFAYAKHLGWLNPKSQNPKESTSQSASRDLQRDEVKSFSQSPHSEMSEGFGIFGKPQSLAEQRQQKLKKQEDYAKQLQLQQTQRNNEKGDRVGRVVMAQAPDLDISSEKSNTKSKQQEYARFLQQQIREQEEMKKAQRLTDRQSTFNSSTENVARAGNRSVSTPRGNYNTVAEKSPYPQSQQCYQGTPSATNDNRIISDRRNEPSMNPPALPIASNHNVGGRSRSTPRGSGLHEAVSSGLIGQIGSDEARKQQYKRELQQEYARQLKFDQGVNKNEFNHNREKFSELNHVHTESGSFSPPRNDYSNESGSRFDNSHQPPARGTLGNVYSQAQVNSDPREIKRQQQLEYAAFLEEQMHVKQKQQEEYKRSLQSPAPVRVNQPPLSNSANTPGKKKKSDVTSYDYVPTNIQLEEGYELGPLGVPVRKTLSVGNREVQKAYNNRVYNQSSPQKSEMESNFSENGYQQRYHNENIGRSEYDGHSGYEPSFSVPDRSREDYYQGKTPRNNVDSNVAPESYHVHHNSATNHRDLQLPPSTEQQKKSQQAMYLSEQVQAKNSQAPKSTPDRSSGNNSQSANEDYDHIPNWSKNSKSLQKREEARRFREEQAAIQAKQKQQEEALQQAQNAASKEKEAHWDAKRQGHRPSNEQNIQKHVDESHNTKMSNHADDHDYYQRRNYGGDNTNTNSPPRSSVHNSSRPTEHNSVENNGPSRDENARYGRNDDFGKGNLFEAREAEDDGNISRRWRKPMPVEEQEQVLYAMKEKSAGKGGAVRSNGWEREEEYHGYSSQPMDRGRRGYIEEELPLAADSTYLPNRRGIDTAPYNSSRQRFQPAANFEHTISHLRQVGGVPIIETSTSLIHGNDDDADGELVSVSVPSSAQYSTRKHASLMNNTSNRLLSPKPKQYEQPNLWPPSDHARGDSRGGLRFPKGGEDIVGDDIRELPLSSRRPRGQANNNPMLQSLQSESVLLMVEEPNYRNMGEPANPPVSSRGSRTRPQQ